MRNSGKAEFHEPGQSVKIVRPVYESADAVARAVDLRPGFCARLWKARRGNTGIGLALVGAAMGFQDG